MDEKKFLTAIEAQPENRMARLVFADWLEERNDPRGELIRIEEEMRQIPIYADRYWALKPRRRALREAYQKKRWFERLGYKTGYEPVFRDVPDGWKERWRLLREFVERWFGIPMEDVGRPPEGIEQGDPTGDNSKTWEWIPARSPELQRLIGVHPTAFREWFLFLHELKKKKFVVWYYTYVYGGHSEYIPFMSLGEPTFLSVIAKKNLALPDPPVDWIDQEDPNCFYLMTGDPSDAASASLQSDSGKPTGEKMSLEAAVISKFGVHIPRLTTFAFHCLLGAWASSHYPQKGRWGGGLVTRVTAPQTMERQLLEVFPCRTNFDDMQVFERPNMIAVLGPDWLYSPKEIYLRVGVWKSARRSDIPDFLWKLQEAQEPHHGWEYGKFLPSST